MVLMGNHLKILLLLFVTSFNTLSSQVATTFHKLTTQEGLISNAGIYQFHKSNNKMLWFGSFNGLNRFNGETIKQYLSNPQDSTSLSQSEIQGKILGANNNDFWIGTSDAIHYYDNNQDNFKRVYLKWNGKNLKNYNLLLYDKANEELWVNTQHQLFQVKIKKDFKTIAIDSLNQFYGRGESLVSNGNEKLLLIPYKNSLEVKCYNNDRIKWVKQFSFNVDMENEAFTFFFEDETNIWVGANRDIFRVNLKSEKIERIKKNKHKEIENIISIQPFNKNELLVATKNKGIYFLNKKSRIISNQVYHYKNNKLIPFVENIDQTFIDIDKTLWVYSPNNGIYYSSIDKIKFTTSLVKNNPDTDEKNSIISISVDSKNRLWCLSNKGVLVVNSKGGLIPEFQKFSGKNLPFKDSKLYHIFCDDKDNVWISTSFGLYLLTPSNKKINKISTLSSSSKNPAFSYTNQIQNGKVIANSYSSGTFLVKNDGSIPYLVPFTEFKEFKELKELGYFYSGKKRVLIHKMSDYLAIYSNQEDKLIRDTFFNLNSFVTGIASTPIEDKYWLSTIEGLYEIKEDKNQTLTINKDTLFNYRNLKGILRDTLGNLWVSATDKIIKYNPINQKQKIYKSSDGLQSEEFNEWSFSELKNGNFAFGGGNGINIFNPYEIKEYSVQANPIITKILINDQIASNLTCHYTGATNIIEINNLNLPYQDNTLSFRFAPLEYSVPLSCQYKYRISPTETNWVHSGTENFARYANLSPGNYTFEVDATNSDGIWSNNPAKLDITILPPWYQTWWFRTLATLAFAGVGYSIYRNRVQQIQKEADFKRKEAEYKQLAAETETAVLRLQMNPHFIFNSMNSISSYLLQKDIETANDYLGRFAKLMRKILMVAEEPYLPLYEEIELLEQYMQAEAMRFEEKFQYQFNVADEIDEDEVMIPTMILQPFVENAIWHGISNKKGKGRIQIDFKINQEQLICSISDNGIGRQAAASQKTTSDHESKAISITQRRLDLLVTEHNLNFKPSLAIEDLVNQQNHPLGTTVVLILPLI